MAKLLKKGAGRETETDSQFGRIIGPVTGHLRKPDEGFSQLRKAFRAGPKACHEQNLMFSSFECWKDGRGVDRGAVADDEGSRCDIGFAD